MKKKLVSILITFIAYAAMDAILEFLLFKEEINVIESMVSSAIFCLIYFPLMSVFSRNQKSKQDQKEQTQ